MLVRFDFFNLDLSTVVRPIEDILTCRHTPGFLLGIFSRGAKSIVMQISFVMLLFSDQISGRGKTFQGGAPCPYGRKPALHLQSTFSSKNFKFTICSLDVHYMFTIRTLYVHYMYTICSLYVHYMFTICTLYVHYMFTICTQNVHHINTTCSLYVHYMFTICSLYISQHFLNLIFSQHFHEKVSSYEKRKTSLIEDAPIFGRFHEQFSQFQLKCFCITILFQKKYTVRNDGSIYSVPRACLLGSKKQ